MPDKPSSGQTFAQFMQAVDRELVSRCGLTHRDLADATYFDFYRDECTPEEVAIEVLKQMDFPFA